MIGLDTNVLVRYITQDDPDQSARATKLVESLTEDAPGYVSLIVMVELHWVLRRGYKVDRKDTVKVMETLLQAKELVLEQSDAVRRVLVRLTDEVDFADALIDESGQLAGCSYTATFDRRAAKLPGMRLVPARR